MAKRKLTSSHKQESFSLPFDIPPEIWIAVIAQLIKLGWLAWGKAPESLDGLADDVHWPAIKKAVAKFQAWAGLEVDGYPGDITQHSLFQPRICGVPDAMGVDGSCKWPHREVTVAIVNSLPGISDGDFQQSWLWAAEQIDRSCGATLIYKANVRTANIVITVANLGGPNGVLADQVLPCGFPANGSARMRVDSSELWSAGSPPWQGRGTIPLALVLLHEGLHGMGVPHRSPGPGGPAVMDPTLNTNLIKLQPWDIQELVTRYGPPEIPAPPPVPEMWGTAILDGAPVYVKMKT